MECIETGADMNDEEEAIVQSNELVDYIRQWGLYRRQHLSVVIQMMKRVMLQLLFHIFMPFMCIHMYPYITRHRPMYMYGHSSSVFLACALALKIKLHIHIHM